jgi:CrcB protein
VSRPAPSAALLVAVAVGGAVGALLRWSAGEAVPDGTGFPWTTFAVNISGCLAIGLLPAVGAVVRRPVLAAAVGPGLLGGYTTMSAYAEQGRSLLADGQAWTALAYLVGTLGACLGAVLLAERITGHDTRDDPGTVVEP